ncbi:MAG: hypothetical protein DHS20C01_34180 [marine bacterium B5-7]|nr:MAG: hypothetical protein DHS20C01_34180 [marine bacterium B5-7]
MNTSLLNNQNLKRYRIGTHRTRSPADTLERISPYLKEMGITRVANVTGLDRLGIPVVVAVRPGSRSISVSQGKGHELEAAKASAIMESIETWHAERIRLPLRYSSIEELRADGLMIPEMDQLPRTSTIQLDDQTPIFWIEGRNLLDDQKVWLPREMVSTDYTLPEPPGTGYFAANTNGLASGNTFDEAACHAIFEVVERDADALWRQSPVRDQHPRGVDTTTVNDPICQMILSKFTDAGIEVGIWDVTTDAGIASFVCLVAGNATDWADPEFGAGCHSAREVALARALTEAAQARTTFIAGSRDDIGAFLYRPEQRKRRQNICTSLLKRHQPLRRFDAIATYSDDNVSVDLNRTLENLRNIGIRQVLAVDLSLPAYNVAVVKIVIPGLEGAYGHHGENYIPGARARNVLSLPAALSDITS